MTDPRAFGNWLITTLGKNNITQSELARMAGVTRSTISGVITGRRQPGARLMIAIASALRITPEEVFQAAGVLPQSQSTLLDKLNFLLSQLSENEQKDVEDYINYCLDKKTKEKNNGEDHRAMGVVEVEFH